MFLTTLARIIVGATIGWLVGMFLTRVTFWYDNRRLERKMKKIDRKMEKNLLRPLA